MPRRKIPRPAKPPKRADRRRARSASMAFSPRLRTGETERIAERRGKAFELRKKGHSYRAVARQLKVSVNTAYHDVSAELAELRVQTGHDAQDLRDVELERAETMTKGLWPAI